VKSGQTSQESCGERRESAFVHVSIPLTRSSGMDIRHRVRTTWRMQSALSVPLPGRRDSKADPVRSKERRRRSSPSVALPRRRSLRGGVSFPTASAGGRRRIEWLLDLGTVARETRGPCAEAGRRRPCGGVQGGYSLSLSGIGWQEVFDASRKWWTCMNPTSFQRVWVVREREVGRGRRFRAVSGHMYPLRAHALWNRRHSANLRSTEIGEVRESLPPGLPSTAGALHRMDGASEA
jgi:hypothetical protein